MNYAVFSDFDGTISRRDVGYSLFHHFSNGKNDDLLPDWKSGKITTRECLLAEAAMVNASADDIIDFIDKIELDSSFYEFAGLCQKNNYPLQILSDGLDFYIRHLLGKNNLDFLDFIANKSELVDNSIKITFQHQNHSCPSCGICKGEIIRNFRNSKKEKYQIIFIGDGYSDACAAKEADMLFAKKDLIEFCNKFHIDYFDFVSFNDVKDKLKEIGIF